MIDYRYLAGFFDGEGCIHIVKAYRNQRLRTYLSVSLSNTNKEFMYNLKNTLGGHITASNDKRKENRLVYKWTIECQQAKIFLESIYNYLIIKKSQAKIAIEFQSKIKFNGRTSSLSVEEKLNYREKINSFNATRRSIKDAVVY